MAEKKEPAQAKSMPESVEVKEIDPKNVLHLHKPLRNGAEELIFDFDKVTGYDLINCERAAKKKDPTMTMPSFSQSYQAMVAGLAADVRYDDILSLNAKDFSAACLMAQAFLLGAET
ncbi:hypothetical protein [Mitsuokella sp.]